MTERKKARKMLPQFTLAKLFKSPDLEKANKRTCLKMSSNNWP